MYAEERQQAILHEARLEGRAVRRDLTVVERAGFVRRVHGGAIPVERLGFEPAPAVRHQSTTGRTSAAVARSGGARAGIRAVRA